MSTEVKVAHSKVVSPQNQSARISEIPQSPNGTNQASRKQENRDHFQYQTNKEGELVCADKILIPGFCMYFKRDIFIRLLVSAIY